MSSLREALRGKPDEPAEEVTPPLSAQVPKRLSSEAPKSIALPLQGTAKSRHPEYAAYKIYLRKKTRVAAERKAQDEEGIDFSELCEKLLVEYLRT